MSSKEYKELIEQAGFMATPELLAAVVAAHKESANQELVATQFFQLHPELTPAPKLAPPVELAVKAKTKTEK